MSRFELLSFEEYAELLARAGGTLEIPDQLDRAQLLQDLRDDAVGLR